MDIPESVHNELIAKFRDSMYQRAQQLQGRLQRDPADEKLQKYLREIILETLNPYPTETRCTLIRRQDLFSTYQLNFEIEYTNKKLESGRIINRKFNRSIPVSENMSPEIERRAQYHELIVMHLQQLQSNIYDWFLELALNPDEYDSFDWKYMDWRPEESIPEDYYTR